MFGPDEAYSAGDRVSLANGDQGVVVRPVRLNGFSSYIVETPSRTLAATPQFMRLIALAVTARTPRQPTRASGVVGACQQDPTYAHDDGGAAPIIMCEVADTPEARTRGLQGHAPLGAREGMLFVFEDEAPRTFHMGSVSFPIDIVWLLEDGRVAHVVEDIAPGSRGTWTAPAAHVLELAGGTWRRVRADVHTAPTAPPRAHAAPNAHNAPTHVRGGRDAVAATTYDVLRNVTDAPAATPGLGPHTNVDDAPGGDIHAPSTFWNPEQSDQPLNQGGDMGASNAGGGSAGGGAASAAERFRGRDLIDVQYTENMDPAHWEQQLGRDPARDIDEDESSGGNRLSASGEDAARAVHAVRTAAYAPRNLDRLRADVEAMTGALDENSFWHREGLKYLKLDDDEKDEDERHEILTTAWMALYRELPEDKGVPELARVTVHSPQIVETHNMDAAYFLYGKGSDAFRTSWCGNRSRSLYESYGGGGRRRFLVLPDEPEDYVELDGQRVPVGPEPFTISVDHEGLAANINDSQNRYLGKGLDVEGGKRATAILDAQLGFKTHQFFVEAQWNEDEWGSQEEWIDSGFSRREALAWASTLHSFNDYYGLMDSGAPGRSEFLRAASEWANAGFDPTRCAYWWDAACGIEAYARQAQHAGLSPTELQAFWSADGTEEPHIDTYRSFIDAGCTPEDLSRIPWKWRRHSDAVGDYAFVMRELDLGASEIPFGDEDVLAWILCDRTRRLKYWKLTPPTEEQWNMLWYSGMEPGQSPAGFLQLLARLGVIDMASYEAAPEEVIDARTTRELLAVLAAQTPQAPRARGPLGGEEEARVAPAAPPTAPPTSPDDPGTPPARSAGWRPGNHARITDPVAFASAIVDAVREGSGLVWRRDSLNMGKTESTHIDAGTIKRWLTRIGVSDFSGAMDAALGREGLDIIGDTFVLAGLAELARVDKNGRGLTLWRTPAA